MRKFKRIKTEKKLKRAKKKEEIEVRKRERESILKGGKERGD